MTNAVVIAGAVSGVGKTTVSTGLMGLLHRNGLKVQPFKTGPDYIDPTYHTWATGEVSRNLDTWMLSKDKVIELFNRAMQGKDLGVIEGVMGLFDGYDAIGDAGSTAELAKLLNVPVILVLDSRKGARSLAAMAHGYKTFDPALNVAGIILNGIGSERHLEICRESIEHYTGIKVVGYLPRRDDLVLPERHLGLIPTVEDPASHEFLERLLEQCRATFDVEEIIRIAGKADTPLLDKSKMNESGVEPIVSIAIARDKAFSFYYQDSFELLERSGARLLPFSPMTDERLPEGTSAIYIGGGFPELYASELAANLPMKEAIKAAANSGMPVYAECGGLMYLGKRLTDLDNNEFEMVGALPVTSQINSPRLSLGYRTVRALADGPLLKKGEEVRGHEFHWSILEEGSGSCNAYAVTDREDRIEGFQRGNLLASYIHIHLASRPGMAERFVSKALMHARHSY